MFKFEEGEIILVDKPLGWTSFDVVRKIRNIIHIKKVGHAGTLDPLATGLLIVCTGKMTKMLNDFQMMPKEYTGTFVIGQTTPSYDLETAVTEKKSIEHIHDDDILRTIGSFKGEIMQVPPAHSAVKMDGSPVYKKARSGQEVKLKPRKVTVIDLEITDIQKPRVRFYLKCSKGFYVRSLAHDFGKALGTGAYLSDLRRIKIGKYSVDDALTIENFEKNVNEWKYMKG